MAMYSIQRYAYCFADLAKRASGKLLNYKLSTYLFREVQ